MYENEYLAHFGVKGMKWGVRRKRNTGSLSDKQIKKYAKKGYAKDSLNSNKIKVGKAYDLYTGAHKLHASAQYETSSKKKNKARAEAYLKEKNQPITKKVGKAIGNTLDKRREKAKKRDEQLKRRIGYGDKAGAAWEVYKAGAKYTAKKKVKGLAASFLNQSANAYISSSNGSYNMKRGVDFVRKAGIRALSISTYLDAYRAGTDIGKAYVYASQKRK